MSLLFSMRNLEEEEENPCEWTHMTFFPSTKEDIP